MKVEKRTINSTLINMQCRSADDGKKYIRGYFVVFGSVYTLWGNYTESVAPGAFDGQLNNDIRCLINHDTRLVLGRTKAGTLVLKVDEKGLWGEVEINEKDIDAMNLYERVKRGDVNQCSFGFEIVSQEETIKEDGSIHWTLKEVRLYEVTIATFPAYEETEVSVRKKDAENIAIRQKEVWKSKALKKLKGE